MFQSHNGSIATQSDIRLLGDMLGFNPIMVRLRLWRLIAKGFLIIWFQSHNGSIATNLNFHALPPSFLFQSHNGSIATLSTGKALKSFTQFQSHNGSIATFKDQGEMYEKL